MRVMVLLVALLLPSPARADASVRAPPPRCGEPRWRAVVAAVERWRHDPRPRDFGMVDAEDPTGRLAVARAGRLMRRQLDACAPGIEWSEDDGAWIARLPDERWEGDWTWRFTRAAAGFDAAVDFTYLGCH